MTAEMLLQIVTGGGVVAGFAAMLRYVHYRAAIRAEVAEQAERTYRAFVAEVERGKPAPLKVAHQCDTPMCPCRGEVYGWCQGCDRTPNVRLMGWTEGGLYRCRSCRADGPMETPVAELLGLGDPERRSAPPR